MSGKNRHRVKINQLGRVVPYDKDTSMDTSSDLIVYGENNNYDRDREILEFKKKKMMESEKSVTLPTAQELYFERDEMRRAREKIYEKILGDIIQDIKDSNNEENIDCNYRLPMKITHKPTYIFEECVWYVVERLRRDGNMFVRFFDPDTLYINWKVKVISKPPPPEKQTKGYNKKKDTKNSSGYGGGSKKGKKKEVQLGKFQLDF